MTKPLTIWVDEEVLAEAMASPALAEHTVQNLALGSHDLYLGPRARYFEPEWFSDPKLVEAALKRARVEKRKKVKK